MEAHRLDIASSPGSSFRPQVPPQHSKRVRRRVKAFCVIAVPPTQGLNRPIVEDSEQTIQLTQDIVSDRHLWLWRTTKSLAWSILGALKADKFLLSGDQKQANASILGETAQRALQVSKDAPGSENGRQGVKKPPVDIRKYLHKVGIMEIKYIRMLASLCSLTYAMHKATDRSLFRLHGLRLVTTSLIYERLAKEPAKTASQVFEEADGMAASPQLVAGAYHDLKKSAETPVPAMQAIERLEKVEPYERMPTPAEVVGARLSAAAAAAASAAAAAANAAAPIASNISSAAVGITAAPLQAIGSQLQSAASIGQSSAVATVATVTAALDSTWSQRTVTKKQAISSSYWFVADDEQAHTRFFAIQGSNNIDHWKINLQFDPVTFEDPPLGLKVHRGFYEAAEILYDQFLPLVEEHLATSPFAKIVFTGHSLGGSVGTLLMLMFLHRKVVPPLALGPVYTFGAPAIFCATDSSSKASVSVDGEKFNVNTEDVLERMGLNTGAVRNVMMHRDIVPRAFACDYALVADLLCRVSDSFRHLETLRNPSHQAMYTFLGRTLVLQPDEKQKFVFGGGDHPMLPAGANLLALREPWSLSNVSEQLGKRLSNNIQPASAISGQARSERIAERERRSTFEESLLQPPRRTGEANLRSPGMNIDDSGPDKEGGPHLGRPASTLEEAISCLMDTPHPLDILGEPGSYGFTGAISRYHDPENYTKALGGVLRARTRPWKKLPGGGKLQATELPRLNHVDAPLRRSRKVRNRPPEQPSALRANVALSHLAAPPPLPSS